MSEATTKRSTVCLGIYQTMQVVERLEQKPLFCFLCLHVLAEWERPTKVRGRESGGLVIQSNVWWRLCGLAAETIWWRHG